MENRWLPVKEASTMSGLSEVVIYKSYRAGKINATKIKGRYFYDMTSIAGLIEQRKKVLRKSKAKRVKCAFCQEFGRVSLPEEEKNQEYLCWNCGSATDLITGKLKRRGCGVGLFLLYNAGFANRKRKSKILEKLKECAGED